jgi:hypothetical protein
MPHGAMPIVTTEGRCLALDGRTASSAAATCRTAPTSRPDVINQAPVVVAALSKPFRKTRDSFGCSLKS